jgi:CRISPR-associated protein Cst2
MKFHSLAISGIVTIDLHALNNEGSEGNTMMTRMVEIVDYAGKNHTVNAISGDMLKHIQAEHLFLEAKTNNMALCKGCSLFDANRICADEEFTQNNRFTETTKDSEILDDAIKKCIIDDAEGILITSQIGGKARSIARKSTVEFGWVIGQPENTRTESYFHAKYVPEGRGKGSGTGENLGRTLSPPASSGQYAVVASIDLFRIGRNDITLAYAEGVDRNTRIKALLKSVLNTFVKPTGAHRNTQSPHILNFTGIITTSLSTVPAPMLSSLNPNYEEEIKKIAVNLNKLEKTNPIEVKPFAGFGEFSEIMGGIITTIEPYGD